MNSLSSLKKNFPLTPITYIHIEEPLKKFKGKFSNAHTIQILTQMNAMISGYLYRKLKIQPVYFNVSKARKMVFPELKFPEGANKKYIIWGAVMKVHPEINWKYSAKTHMLMDENFDMCDAWVVGMAGIVSMIRMQKAKTKKDKTTA